MTAAPGVADRIAAALAGAARDAAPHFVGVEVPVPAADLLLHAGLAIEERFYLERPSEGLRLLALGRRAAIEADGSRRFEDVDAQARGVAARVHRTDPQGTPLLFGGFAFSPRPGAASAWTGFPAARLVLPELLWVEQAGQGSARAFVPVQPGETVDAVTQRCAAQAAHWESLLRDRPTRPEIECEPGEIHARAEHSPDHFRREARRALRAIARGDLEKLVLARGIRLTSPGGFDPLRCLDALRRAHPSCATFAVGRGAATFFGATPERLLRVRGKALDTSAVAGSAPRGCNPQEDATLARALQESKKEQGEHAVVVRALRAALEPCCDELEVAEAPRLLRLAAVQHLETPLHGSLREGTRLLAVASRLHPTPAVGGAPREAALAWLEAREGLERGWYAGLVGYVDAAGGGELCVALRSALVRGEAAQLFAGAGLVAGSEPEAELRETRLKLRTLMNTLVEL